MYSNQSWTGQRIVRDTGIQYYEISFVLNFNIENRGEVQTFLAQYQHGRPFSMSLGYYGTYAGKQTGGLVASAQTGKGNMVVNTNNKLAVGELVQFTNHKKIYQVIERTDTSITVFPALQNIVLVNEPIIYENIEIEAVLNPDNEYQMQVGMITSIKLNAMENIV
ncbi:hypothetical protein GKQ23_13020 [Erwinia sp. E602]|nr:hypothetical protein GKQ23_13020 [Erwinia sp. E602]